MGNRQTGLPRYMLKEGGAAWEKLAYTGPSLIGKPIGTPPDQTGPEWIGQRIPTIVMRRGKPALRAV